VFAIWILRSKSAARYVVNGTELNVMRGESDNIVQNVWLAGLIANPDSFDQPCYLTEYPALRALYSAETNRQQRVTAIMHFTE